MKLKQAVEAIEQRFKISHAEDFDNVGLLCGNPEREITGILVCHDSLECVVDEAISKNLNLIVAFHPIVFSGLKSITGKNYVERAVLKAIENKIAIYAIHTAFDNDYFGVNYRICEELGLKNQQILMPKKSNLTKLDVYVPHSHADTVRNAMFEAGAGNIGFYDECSFSVDGRGTFRPNEGSDPYSGTQGVRENAAEEMISVIFESYKSSKIISALKAAHPYEEVAYQLTNLENENQYAGLGRFGQFEKALTEVEFLQLLRDRFSLNVIRHSNRLGKMIETVGVLGGSGASGIKSALAKGCDAYVTADVKYHEFYQGEDRMLICDIGHFESEQFVPDQIFQILSEIFPKFAVSKSLEKTNPVNYFF